MSTKKIKIQFTETCFGTATRFSTQAEARAAAHKYSKQRRYRCEGFFCQTCERFHVRPLKTYENQFLHPRAAPTTPA
jgi:hypothetical protein